jgi:GNAT superfamily N-acetyltransferase/DNA-binding MarR family transcriptional regulator
MDDSQLIADIRAFTRFYTPLIGALDAGHLKTPYSLAEARVIYELGRRGKASHKELARSLKLDPGYLSRINLRLTELGLTSAIPDGRARRGLCLALTSDGEAAFDQLDEASDDLVAGLVAPLDAGKRRELADAMRMIRSVLGDEAPRGPLIIRSHRIGEIGWMVHRQGLLYNQQFGWNGDFEALIAGIYRDYYDAPDKPRKDLWVAEQNGAIVGSIFVMPSEGLEGSAQLRMLYVEPSARGQGVGTALVAQAVSFARGNGYRRMRLWTHTIQESARKIYAAAGFKVVETVPEDNFGMQMTGEIWETVF